MRRAGRAPRGLLALAPLIWATSPAALPAQDAAPAAEAAAGEVVFAMNVPVPMRDGVHLATDLYRPPGDGPFPVILVRTPYGSESPAHSERGRFWASHGYAYAVQDVRGKYDSEGAWYGRRDEGEDGYDTIAWLAARPWSSGAVGMLGASYLGLVQWEVAPLASPHLKALAPIVAPVTLGRSLAEWRRLAVYGRGSPAMSELSWLVSTDGRVNQNTAAYDWDRLFRHLPLAEIPATLGRDIPIWETLIRTERGLWEVYLASAARGRWREPIEDWPDPAERYAAVDVPILQIVGWFDGSSEGNLYNRARVLEHATNALARENQWVVVGPWPHAANRSTTVGALDFGPDAVIDMDHLLLRWFDRWLKGERNGVEREAPLKLFLMGANEWREAREWPLPGTRFVRYYVSTAEAEGEGEVEGGTARVDDGRLSVREPGRDERPDTYTYDPADPTPAITGGENAEMAMDGPVDVRAIEARADVLTYTTEPLAEDVDVMGPVSAVLYVASSAPETEVIVRLLDVHPDGAAYPVWYTYANAFPTKHGTVVGRTADGEEIRRLEIELPPTGQRFLRGHRVRVHVASAAFPLFRHLNTAEDPATATRWQTARQTIFHDAERPSHVVLPVVPAGALAAPAGGSIRGAAPSR